jgi:cysteinyl-tRNA synthetase
MLNIYNTLTSSKEPFEQIGEAVRMYVCGVTVYDLCHLGHARSSVAFDIVRRTLEWLGMNVTFVKNFTDIDDKIIRKAADTGEDWRSITERFIKAHNEDMSALNIRPPTRTPLATEHIPDMVAFCRVLEEKGCAYYSDGDLYYRVRSFDGYGKLSHRNIDELLSGARVDVNASKENPLDFALWKKAKPGEPSWDSPWGKGRPGWHIECSVMCGSLLGETIDIHGGGQDLIFPHHENEIAQSEAKNGRPFARFWIHNGFVNIKEEKMSKSLGNFFTIRDVLKLVNGETLRFFLLSTHYRSPLEYAQYKLYEAESSLERIYFYKDELAYAAASPKGKDAVGEIEKINSTFYYDFTNSISDDFNTPGAIAAVFDMVRSANRILSLKLDEGSLLKLREVSNGIFNTIDKVLGVAGRTSEEWFAANLIIPVEEVAEAIKERAAARESKNFAAADAIRGTMAEKGVELIDTAGATRYRTKRIRRNDGEGNGLALS